MKKQEFIELVELKGLDTVLLDYMEGETIEDDKYLDNKVWVASSVLRDIDEYITGEY